MTPVNPHDETHSELLCLHILHVLPPDKVPAMEAHLASCEECRAKVDSLRPVVGPFVFWPTEALEPPASASVWGRVAERIAQTTGRKPMLPGGQRWTEPEWEDVAPGISCKLLGTDPTRNRVSMMVRLAPGAEYPPHRHAGTEELHLLHGELFIDDRLLRPGDYNRAEAGTSDSRVWSKTGCTCVLITSTQDELG